MWPNSENCADQPAQQNQRLPCFASGLCQLPEEFLFVFGANGLKMKIHSTCLNQMCPKKKVSHDVGELNQLFHSNKFIIRTLQRNATSGSFDQNVNIDERSPGLSCYSLSSHLSTTALHLWPAEVSTQVIPAEWRCYLNPSNGRIATIHMNTDVSAFHVLMDRETK